MTPLVVFTLLLGLSGAGTGQKGAPAVVGIWQVEYDLSGSRHVLRLEAEGNGKAIFRVMDERSSLVEPAEPSPAHWDKADGGRVRITGPVEFPIGNVGRERGTVVFTGTFETADVLRGRVAFYGQGADPKDPRVTPARQGAFRATRVR